MSLIPVGEVTIWGKNLHIYLHEKFDIKGTKLIPYNQWLAFSLEQCRFNLARDTSPKEKKISKLLTLILKNLHVDKMVRIYIQLHLTQSKTSNKSSYILQIPATKLQMDTTSYADSDTINYKYKTQFPKPINVTTNLAEYNFLRSILELYKDTALKEFYTSRQV